MSEPVAPAEVRPDEIADLLRRAQAGDVAAFERLISQYQRKVYTFALTCCGDPEAAQDLAQEALVKVFRSLGSYRFQSSFSTWLYSIVRNTFLDERRSRAGRESTTHRLRSIDGPGGDLLVQAHADPRADAEALLLEKEARGQLQNALREVPEPFREVLFLSDLEGLGQDEVARALAIAVGTVKSRLSRGREALREVLFRQRKKEEQP